ncbi:MAG TPA: hypothetical protein VKB38_05155 [Terracidiphilus sp.]|nr:hypothetical protein [Terracidiphilus sp.]
MKHLALFASALFLMPAAFAQSKGSCSAPVALDAHSGMSLNIESISSEVDVVGTDEPGIRVSCTLPDGEDPDRVALRAERTGDFGKIQVTGGPMNNLHVRIEVPKKTGLRLRMGAGQVKVNDVSGDKDIDIHAGEVIVSHVDSTQYHSIHASVEIGDVNAAAFGAEKGGFFRSFDKDNAGGPYRLRVHVMTGSVELN